MKLRFVIACAGIAATGALALGACSSPSPVQSLPVAPQTHATAAPQTTSASQSTTTEDTTQNTNSGQDAFLAYANSQSWGSTLTDADLVKLGDAVCADWSDGADFASVLSDVQSASTKLNDGWSTSDDGEFIGASTQAFCANYSSKVTG